MYVVYNIVQELVIDFHTKKRSMKFLDIGGLVLWIVKKYVTN